MEDLDTPTPTMAKQIGQAAIALHQEMTGHSPQAAAVLLNENTLTVTLHGALSTAEQALAMSAEGEARVQELNKQQFNTSCERLRQEIKRITDVEVREAMAEVETATGMAVQTFQLAQNVPAENWSGVSPVRCS